MTKAYRVTLTAIVVTDDEANSPDLWTIEGVFGAFSAIDELTGQVECDAVELVPRKGKR